MRLLILHQTEYRFTEPQARVVQLLRMYPTSHIGQNVVNWHIDVDCDARVKHSNDGFGNVTSMLYLDGPVERIGLRVSGEVLTEDCAGVVSGAIEPLPPAVFIRPTELTAPNATILDLAREHGPGSNDDLSRAHGLKTAVHKLIARTEQRSSEVRSAQEVVAAGSGRSMDMAHVLVAAARAAGFAARFVTGYIYREDAAHGHRQTEHYWAELNVPGYSWIGFDPTNDHCPDARYVRVAKGLDFRDAAPLSGARVGGGDEMLNIGIDITVSQGQLQS
jgi:transglutaminase-like putative cysteine protease